MGDISSPQNAKGSPTRPGIMLVRPNLHSNTTENASTFKRWTVMHFCDLLDCTPPPPSLGLSRTLRYINTAGELLYTIHADDLAIWKTEAYHDVSRRLDLENTRLVEEGEEAVLPAPSSLGLGKEPMVWDLVNAEFAIFEANEKTEPQWKGVHPYHDVPFDLLGMGGAKPSAPPCLLVTLTYTGLEVENDDLPKQLTSLQGSIAAHLQSAFKDRSNGKVYTTMYRHLPDAQPNMHPVIKEGKDGCGSWVLCMFVQADISDGEIGGLEVELKDDLSEMMRSEGEEKGRDVKVGVWRGELFRFRSAANAHARIRSTVPQRTSL